MANVYGSNTFGGGKYGLVASPALTGALVWALQIGWGGSFTGENEASRMVGYTIRRGREQYVSRNGDRFEPLQPGGGEIILDNHDGRYDPYNTASPLYPNVRTGVPIQISVLDVASGTVYPRFYGRIDDIVPISGEDRVRVTLVDDLQTISDESVSAVIRFNTDTRAAINAVLDGVGWSRPRQVEASDNPLVIFALEDANPLGVIQDLADSSLSLYFVDGRGKFRFYGRGYSGQASHDIDESQALKEIALSQPWDNIRNAAICYANRWARSTVKTLWSNPGLIYVPASTTKTLDIQFNNPSVPVPPVTGVDYQNGVIAVPDASGGLTSATLFTVWLSNVTAKGCRVNIRNNTIYASNCYRLQVRGYEYVNSVQAAPGREWSASRAPSDVNTRVRTEAQDATSISTYGRRVVMIDSPFLQDANFSAAYADMLKTALKDPQKNPIIQIENPGRAAQAFAPELYDTINLTVASKGIDEAYRLGKLEETWLSENGQSVKTTFWLWKAISDNRSITPEPVVVYDPIGEIPPPNDGSGTLPPSTTSQVCVSDLAAPANGAIPVNGLAGVEISSYGANLSATGAVNVILRSPSHTNRTYVQVTGDFEYTEDGGKTWKEITDNTWMTVKAVGLDGSVVASCYVSGTGKSRAGYLVVEPPTEIAYLTLEATQGELGTVVCGDTLATGNVAATVEAGVELAGLTVGAYYSLEAAGGPWYPIATDPSKYHYTFSARLGSGSWSLAVEMGYVYAPPFIYFNTSAKPTWAITCGRVDSYHARMVFKASETSIYFRCAELGGVFSDNGGSLDYILRPVTSIGGSKRLKIQSVNLFNVCPVGSV